MAAPTRSLTNQISNRTGDPRLEQAGDQIAHINGAIADIADQLCLTVDDAFDFRVHVDTDNIQLQKLNVLINFLLEKVRRNIGSLTSLANELEQKVA